MAIKWLLGLALGVTLAGASLGTARADGSSNGPRFTVVTGQVTVRGANGTESAVVNTPLYPGDYIETGPSSRAEIVLGSGTAIHLGGGVQAHYIDRNQVQLADGTLEVDVLANGYGSTQIDTPTVTVRSSSKSQYRVSITSGGATAVTSRSGSVDVVTPQHTYTVAAGKAVVASGRADNPTITDTTAVAVDSLDQFSTDRDQVLLQDSASLDPWGGGSGYGYPTYSYPGYAYPAAVVVAAPLCTWSPFYGGYGGWGWGFSFGFTGGCGYGGYYGGLAYSWPWYGGWYSPYYSYCCGYPYYPYYPPYYPPVHRLPAPWHGTPIVRPIVARNDPPARTLPVRIDPVRVDPVRTAPVRTEPVRTEPVRTAPVVFSHAVAQARKPVEERTTTTAVHAPNAWERFDAGRGTHVASQAPTRTDPTRTDPTRTDPTRTDPTRADPGRGTPVKGDPVKTDPVQSETWDRFTQERGDISVDPQPVVRAPTSGIGSTGGAIGSSHLGGSSPIGGSPIGSRGGDVGGRSAGGESHSSGGGGGGASRGGGGGGRPPH